MVPRADLLVTLGPPNRAGAVAYSYGQRAPAGGAASRCDKLAVRYEATIHITAINTWLRCLARPQ